MLKVALVTAAGTVVSLISIIYDVTTVIINSLTPKNVTGITSKPHFYGFRVMLFYLCKGKKILILFALSTLNIAIF